MEIKGVVVDGLQFEGEQLSSKNFLDILKTRLGVRNSEPEIIQGLEMLGSYKVGAILGEDAQLTIAKMLISADAKAIIDGEILLEGRNIEEVKVLKNFAITIDDFVRRAQEIIDGGGEPQLLHEISGTSLGIFSIVEDGEIMFFIDDINNPDEGEYGFVVDKNGESFQVIDDNDFVYLIYSAGTDTYILEGSINKGFEKVGVIKGIIPNDVAVLKKGFFGYIEDGLFIIKDIYDEKVVFECAEGDIDDMMPSGNPVDIVTYNGITRFIFISKGDDGNMIFKVRDENGADVFWSRIFPHIIITESGVYTVLYSHEGARYYLSHEENGVLLDSIRAIIDDNGQYYFGGNYPDYFFNNDGTFTFRFVYQDNDENGAVINKEGYIISGIECDLSTNDRGNKKAIDLLLAQSPSSYIH